jgi:hypothetical protein
MVGDGFGSDESGRKGGWPVGWGAYLVGNRFRNCSAKIHPNYNWKSCGWVFTAPFSRTVGSKENTKNQLVSNVLCN